MLNFVSTSAKRIIKRNPILLSSIKLTQLFIFHETINKNLRIFINNNKVAFNNHYAGEYSKKKVITNLKKKIVYLLLFK